MKNRMRLFCGLLVLTGFLMACNSDPAPTLPTAIPVASVPAATPTSLPPTQDLTQLTPSPTATPPAVTPEPEVTPTPAEPETAAVTISDPTAGMVFLMGDEVAVRGRAQLPATARLSVILLSQNWLILAETEATQGDIGWQSTLTIPYNVGGNGRILTEILDENDNVLASDEISVWIEPNTDNMDRYLLLNRPVIDGVAVRGYNFLFDGMVLNPTNNTVTISIWTEDCRLQVTRQNFVLGSSVNPFSWLGFIIVPAEAEGEACAIASFGQPGEADWREIQVPIMVYPTTAAEARQIEIARPLPQTIYQAGDRLFVYGTAPGITERVLQVGVLLENGRIIDENEVTADLWGYWEFETILPPDVEGPAEISVSAGEVDALGYVVQQTLITIQPGNDNIAPDPDEPDEETSP
jgi:hypothetical protein